MNQVVCCWLIAAVAVRTAFSQSNELVVETPYGFVMGHPVASYEGRRVAAFEGIPYAKPPVGELRFEEPQPPEPWSNILVANKRYRCLQYTNSAAGFAGDEDCLYLYIYVPRETIRPGENLDVIINLHGGGFASGGPRTGYEYITDRDLIYVSLNYRLGILGFLSTQDAVVPGNNGLKDQTLAMKWVKENIEYFGGNPQSITITGQSAGAASVHFHYLSPLSTGLFTRGISHSGTALNPISLSKTPLRSARRLGAIFNCDTTSSKVMVECLRSQPVESVVSAQRYFYTFINFLPLVPFGPVIEVGNPGAFLPDHPYKLMAEGKINDAPWVVSNVKDELAGPAGFILVQNKLQELDQRWYELAPSIFEYNDTANDQDKTSISNYVKSHYFRNEPLSSENIRDLIRLFSERLLYVDDIKAALAHAQVARSPVYYYFFEYYTNDNKFFNQNFSVVSHGDDYKLLYRQPNSPEVLSDSNRRMKDIFVDFLYNFASQGIATLNGNHWPPLYSSAEPTSYMHIYSPDIIRRERAINEEPLAFWQQLPLWENERVLSSLQSLHLI